MKKSVIVKSQFTALHWYPDAPEEVSFLRHPHRHIFYVEMYFRETEDRQIEFFMMKSEVNTQLEDCYNDCEFSKSCEMIAEELLNAFQHDGAYKVKVWEDNENGAEVELA